MRPTYDRRQANRISFRIVVVLALAFGAYTALEMAIDPVSVTEDRVEVRSLFGISVPLRDIRNLELVDRPLVVTANRFGNDAFGLFREGNYDVEGYGIARVYLRNLNAPYVLIRTDDRVVLISLGSKDKNELIYDAIKLRMK